jgi:ATP-dependent helicase HepA
VVQVEARQVQLFFPGGGEARTYSIESAPLKRVHFAPGDKVRGHSGDEFAIVSVSDEGGLFTYISEEGSLKEAELCDSLSFDNPESRLLSGHVDSSDLFELRLETHRNCQQFQTSPVRGFTGARIELLPHQIYIAHEVSRRQMPRVLLADEVGLGKTIEACLILHRMIVCGMASRALVLVPDALVHQWFVELLRRFNMTFAIVNDASYEDSRACDGENPFTEATLVLCGIEMLANSKERAMQALNAGWDILIVDEAHHLRWSEEEVSREYKLVELFAARVAGLLLLTASPEQAGVAGHFARLRLLDPARYSDFKQFVAEHEEYADVASRAEALLGGKSEEELHELLDRHGPGRVMFRNTRAGMTSFPKRIPHLVPLDVAEGSDPRAEWLGEFVRKNAPLKVLVICRSSSEVIWLKEKLHSMVSCEIAMFHEGLPLVQCDRQAAWFAEPEGARVLITSGIGGEGRNFQFVNNMVLMDVPEDPEFVEQRIGRLDRIGQVRDIHIHVPYVRGSHEEGIVRWLDEGLDAFSTPLVGGYRMLLEFGDRLGDISDELIVETREHHDSLCREIAAGRDRLLELNSCRPAIAEDLVSMIQEADDCDVLEEYMASVYEQFGVGVESLGAGEYLLRPDQLYCEEFPLPRDVMRITYDRGMALERPILTLLSWDHPMVHGAMELILGSDRGSCAVSRSSAVQGQILQAVFVLETVSVHRVAVSRFFPQTPIVVQVDVDMNLIDELPAIEGDADSWVVLEDLKLRNELFPAMLSRCRERADEVSKEVVKDVLTVMQKDLAGELRRLKRLQAVNDHVRQEEVDALAIEHKEFEQSVSEARIRLDAVRIVIK